jgi:hypothetical protein
MRIITSRNKYEVIRKCIPLHELSVVVYEPKNFGIVLMEKGTNKYTPEDYITLPSGHRVLKKEFERSLSAKDDSRKSEKVIIDKLPSMSGSIAGASSKFLLAVQKHKEKEEARLADLERSAAEQAESLEFERQRLERKRYFDEEAAKKREKRQKRKSKQSTHGLDLPVDVIQQIVADERATSNTPADFAKSTKPHPLVSSASSIPPVFPVSSITKPKPPGPVSIRIVEEDD